MISLIRSLAVFTIPFAVLAMTGKNAIAGAIKQPLPSSMNGEVVGPGLGFGNTVNADLTGKNNDNKAIKGNSFVSMDLRFDKLDVIDIIFSVENTGGFMPNAKKKEDVDRNPCGNDPCGTTEYRYEVVVGNNTGKKLTGLDFRLGFGTGNKFQLSKIGDFLDFDTPDKDTKPNRNGQEQGFTHNANTINWKGMAGANAGAFFLNFDVPDFNEQMPKDAKTNDGYQLTLRVKAVPEPLTILGAGTAVGFGTFFKGKLAKKHKKDKPAE